jgi:uncharacterized protein YmfQ (DUF2313 family)
MKTPFNRTTWALYVAGTLALTVPVTAGATESSEHWNQGQAELQKNLPPGQASDAYRRKLEDMGYKITSTNYDKPDYLEYEVVKGDQTWEIQIDVDDNTHKATKVDVAQNLWKTDATKAALEDSNRMASEDTYREGNRRTAVRSNQYSDRDRVSTNQLVKEIEGMPTGHDKQYYKDALRKRGYDIARVDKDETDEMMLEAVKDGRSVKVNIDFDEDSGKSTKVDASSLWAESEATSRTREAQQGEARPVPQRSTSDMERRSQADTPHTR